MDGHSIQFLHAIWEFGIGGAGGGALMTPMLILAFGIHPVTAVGTILTGAILGAPYASRSRDRRSLSPRSSGFSELRTARCLDR